MTKTFLTTSALALILGLGPAIAQSGGDVRSNDRKIEKTLDNKDLTPIRPMRRVGENNWPDAKTPSPTQAMPPANSAQNTAPADSAQNTSGQAAAKDDTKTPPDNRAGNNATQPAAAKQATQNPASASQPNDRAQQAGRDNDAAQQNARQDRDQNRDKSNTAADQASGSQDKHSFASIRLGTDANGRVAVNEAQERQIAGALRHQRVQPVAANISVTVGMAVPRDIRLGAVSADLVAVLPQFRGYSFFSTRGEIAIVEPSSQKVVAVVPLQAHATASREPREPSRERTTRETSRAVTTRPADTTARTEVRPPQREVTVGSAIQDEDVIIEPAPRTTTIYRMVPAYPRYRIYSDGPPVRIYPPYRYSPDAAQQ